MKLKVIFALTLLGLAACSHSAKVTDHRNPAQEDPFLNPDPFLVGGPGNTGDVGSVNIPMGNGTIKIQNDAANSSDKEVQKVLLDYLSSSEDSVPKTVFNEEHKKFAKENKDLDCGYAKITSVPLNFPFDGSLEKETTRLYMVFAVSACMGTGSHSYDKIRERTTAGIRVALKFNPNRRVGGKAEAQRILLNKDLSLFNFGEVQ